MSSGTTTADNRHSVEATLNILRRLLDEESLILAQLTYVVTHIHAPLLEGCNPVDATGKRMHQIQNKKGDADTSAILTFAQYWELFANIATLHEAQSTLVGKLESAITYSTSLLEQQEEKQRSRVQQQGKRVTAQGRSVSDSGKEEEEEEEQEYKYENDNDHKEGDVDVLQIIPEIFCSAAMRHYMAEHMMYSLNYTRNVAPRVLELWRLWRARLDKQINGEERQQIALYGRFLHFLWDIMGKERGVPDDPRVVYIRLPETPVAPISAPPPSKVRDSNSNSNSNHHNNHNSNSNNHSSSKSGSAFHTLMHELPPIPRDWRGFETLLLLLATPLASLRRYMHVARCLVESRFLRRTMRVHLQSEFVDVVALRIAEEGSIVLDELARQDVEHILALIDESTVSPTSVQVPFPSSTASPSLSSTLNTTLSTNTTATTNTTTTTSTNTTTGTPLSLYTPGGKKCPRIPPDLDGSRTLVHYGHLTKRFRRGRHERLMFLFSDWLCYVEELANGRMRLRASIALETLKVVELDDAPDAVNGFDIVTNESRLTFFAPTPEQKHQWVDALRSTVMAHVKKTKKLAAEAPVVPTITTTTEGGGVLLLGQQQQQQQQQQSGEFVRLIRATAPPLSHNSRLQRQRRVDQLRQERLLMRRRSLQSNSTTATNSTINTNTATITTATNTTTTLPAAMTTVNTLKASHLEPSPASVTSESSEKRRRAFSWRSPHGNFDVTSWAQQSADTVHRRVRSTDFLLHALSPRSPRERSMADIEMHKSHHHHNHNPSSAVIPTLVVAFTDDNADGNNNNYNDDNNISPDPHNNNNNNNESSNVVGGTDTPGKPPRTPMMRLVSERFQEQSAFQSSEKSPHSNSVKVFQQKEEEQEQQEEQEEEEYNEEETKVLPQPLPLDGERCSSSMKRDISVDVSRFSTDDVLTIDRELREGPLAIPTTEDEEEEEEEEEDSNNTDTNSNINNNNNDNSSDCEPCGVQYAPTQKNETRK